MRYKVLRISQTRNRLTDTENKLLVTSRERKGGRGKRGVGDYEVQTTVDKINKLQGCILQHRGYSQYFLIIINRV